MDSYYCIETKLPSDTFDPIFTCSVQSTKWTASVSEGKPRNKTGMEMKHEQDKRSSRIASPFKFIRGLKNRRFYLIF